MPSVSSPSRSFPLQAAAAPEPPISSRRAGCCAAAVLVFIAVLCSSAVAQTASPASDTYAVTILQEGRAALGVAASPVSSVSLDGSFIWTAGGSTYGGAATLVASGTSQSRLDLTAGGFQRSEVRSSTPAGEWTDTSGQLHRMTPANCWSDAAWFSPLLLAGIAADPSVIVLYAGQESHDGVLVDHVQTYRWLGTNDTNTNSSAAALSLTDLYLDANSHFPVAVAYPVHLDDDDTRSIPTEIEFGDYRLVNGVQVPFRVTRKLGGSPNLNITLNSASINIQVPSTTFAVQ